MFFTLLLGVINTVLSCIGFRWFKLSGLDIVPVAMMLIAVRGDSILFGALVMTISTAIVGLAKIKYLWLTVPATLAVGYLALVMPNLIVLLIVYHLICLVFAIFMQFFGVRYILFILLNVGLNLFVGRAFL